MSTRRIVLPSKKVIAPWRRPIRRSGSLTYNQAVLADSPTLFWGLSDSSGLVAVDLSGNGRDGVYDGGITLGAAGVVQDGTTAISGNGSVNIARSGAIGVGLVPFTMEWALRPSSVIASSNGVLMQDALQNPGGAGAYVNADGSVTFGPPPFFGGTTAAGTVVNGQNAIFAFTFDTVNVRFYKNGVLVGGPSNLGSSVVAMAYLQVGATGIAATMRGAFHKFAVYPSQLSAAQLLVHFNASGI